MRRKTTTYWWEIPLQVLFVACLAGIPLLIAALFLFKWLFGDEFTVDDVSGQYDTIFLLVLVYLGALAGYFLGASNGYDTGKRDGLNEARSDSDPWD